MHGFSTDDGCLVLSSFTIRCKSIQCAVSTDFVHSPALKQTHSPVHSMCDMKLPLTSKPNWKALHDTLVSVIKTNTNKKKSYCLLSTMLCSMLCRIVGVQYDGVGETKRYSNWGAFTWLCSAEVERCPCTDKTYHTWSAPTKHTRLSEHSIKKWF